MITTDPLTIFGNRPNSQCSLAVSAIHNTAKLVDNACEEIAAFYAPGECLGLVLRGLPSMEKIATEHGYLTETEMMADIQARVSPRMAHELTLLGI